MDNAVIIGDDQIFLKLACPHQTFAPRNEFKLKGSYFYLIFMYEFLQGCH